MFNTNNILKRQQPIDEMQYLSVYSTPLSWVANYPTLKTYKKEYPTLLQLHFSLCKWHVNTARTAQTGRENSATSFVFKTR